MLVKKSNNIQQIIEIKQIQQLQKSFNAKHRSDLKSCRFITKNKLPVKSAPVKKSDTVTHLLLGDLVRVIDSSNKSWLYIQGETEGEVFQGWIYRRYTKFGPGC